jgi:hypothetical protein
MRGNEVARRTCNAFQGDGMIEATVHIVWDEEGNVAAHIDAGEAADILDGESEGRFRRVLALKVRLPSAGPINMELGVAEDGATPVLKSAKIS